LDKMNAVRRSVLLSALILAMAAAPTAAWADMGTEVPNEGGIGAVAALSTLIYGPVKLTYATLGLLIGGAAWGLSGGDQQVLEAVVTPALRGDYVVTPEPHPHGARSRVLRARSAVPRSAAGCRGAAGSVGPVLGLLIDL
jgi:hypothetical protein